MNLTEKQVVDPDYDCEWANHEGLEKRRVKAIIMSTMSLVCCSAIGGIFCSLPSFILALLPRYDIVGRHWTIRKAMSFYFISIILAMLGALIGITVLVSLVILLLLGGDQRQILLRFDFTGNSQKTG